MGFRRSRQRYLKDQKTVERHRSVWWWPIGVWYEIWRLIQYFKTRRQTRCISALQHLSAVVVLGRRWERVGRTRHSLKSLLLFPFQTPLIGHGFVVDLMLLGNWRRGAFRYSNEARRCAYHKRLKSRASSMSHKEFDCWQQMRQQWRDGNCNHKVSYLLLDLSPYQ